MDYLNKQAYLDYAVSAAKKSAMHAANNTFENTLIGLIVGWEEVMKLKFADAITVPSLRPDFDSPAYTAPPAGQTVLPVEEPKLVIQKLIRNPEGVIIGSVTKPWSGTDGEIIDFIGNEVVIQREEVTPTVVEEKLAGGGVSYKAGKP